MKALKKVFRVILETANTHHQWRDDDVDRVYKIARELFEGENQATQKTTFEFMKSMCSAFYVPDNDRLRKSRGPQFTKFFAFFFEVLFRLAMTSELCREASEYAVEYCTRSNCYQLYALAAVEVDRFVGFPLDSRFEKRTLKNLLSIASEKVTLTKNVDPLTTGTTAFIERICEMHDSCDIVIGVCDFLSRLFQNIGKTGRRAIMQEPHIFQWILLHVSPFTSEKECWEAVASFFTRAFLWADFSTKNILVDQGVFLRIHEMFLRLRYTRPEVIVQLLEAVQAVCEGPELHYVNQILNYGIILNVLPYVGDPTPGRQLRTKASSAVNAFMLIAEPEQLYRAISDGLAAELVKLMRSGYEPAIKDALRWLFISNERLFFQNNGELYPMFTSVVTHSRGVLTLSMLERHENLRIRWAAAVIRRRLQESLRPLSLQERVRRTEENGVLLRAVPATVVAIPSAPLSYRSPV